VQSESGTPPVRTWAANKIDRKLVAEKGGREIRWAKEMPITSDSWFAHSLHFNSDRVVENRALILGCGDFACLVDVW